jgi:hypothetical protein
MFIIKNYTISNNKEKIKSATIEKGDDIAVVTFFATKPQKKGKFAISLQHNEEGGGNCRVLFQYKVVAFLAMLQGKIIISKTKEKGDGTCRRLLCETTLQRNIRRGRRKRQTVLQRSSTIDSPSSGALQRSCIAGRRRRRQLLSPSSWSCAVATQEEEEGDNNCRRLLRGVAL